MMRCAHRKEYTSYLLIHGTPGQKVRNGTFREAPLEDPLSPGGGSPCVHGAPYDGSSNKRYD